MKKHILLAAIAFIPAIASAQYTAKLPTTCNPNSPGDCTRATAVVNPDGTFLSGGSGGGTSNATSNQNYTATQAGTGYAIGDVIVRVVNSAPASGVVAGAYWINETQGTLLSTAPTLSSLTQLPNMVTTQQPDTYTAPTSYSAAVNTVVPITIGGGQGTAAITITGLTASGATLTASVSDNRGASYNVVRYMGTATVPGATTITTDGIYSFALAGHTNLQLQVTTGGTGNFTAASNLSAQVRELNLGGAGTASTNPLFATVTGTTSIGSGGLGTAAAPVRTDPTGTTTQPISSTQEATIATNQTNGTQIARATGITAAGAQTQLLTSTLGVLAAPTAGTANSTGTVTAVAASTSTTVCPATTNPVVYEVQIYGAAPVLLGLDGQALTAVTPAAGSGAYMLLPTQYTLYSGPVARTNAITAYTGTAMTVVCNIVTRQ